MTRHYFGTDGIRGVVGQDPITPDFFIRLGFAIGSILVKNNTDNNDNCYTYIGAIRLTRSTLSILAEAVRERLPW